MNLGIEFKNCAMNLNISPEKAMTGKVLAIESKFLEILQTKIIAKEEKYLFAVMLVKQKCLFDFLLMMRKKFQSRKYLI